MTPGATKLTFCVTFSLILMSYGCSASDSDGADGLAALAILAAVSEAPDPGDTIAEARDVGASAGAVASISNQQDVDYYRLVLPRRYRYNSKALDERVRITVTPLRADLDVTLDVGMPDSWNVVTLGKFYSMMKANASGIGQPEVLEFFAQIGSDEPDGRWPYTYLRVQGAQPGPYRVEFTVRSIPDGLSVNTSKTCTSLSCVANLDPGKVNIYYGGSFGVPQTDVFAPTTGTYILQSAYLQNMYGLPNVCWLDPGSPWVYQFAKERQLVGGQAYRIRISYDFMTEFHSNCHMYIYSASLLPP